MEPAAGGPGSAHPDALTVLTALAYADGPLIADALAAAPSWTCHRLDAALDPAHAHPDAGGVPVLRHVPPEAYIATPRLDVLDSYQVDALTGRKKPLASVGTAFGCDPSHRRPLTRTLRSHCHNPAHPADIHPAHDTGSCPRLPTCLLRPRWHPPAHPLAVPPRTTSTVVMAHRSA